MSPSLKNYRQKAIRNLRAKLAFLSKEIEGASSEAERADLEYRRSKWAARLLCYEESLQGLDPQFRDRFDPVVFDEPVIDAVVDEIERIRKIIDRNDIERELRGLVAYLRKQKQGYETISDDELEGL